MAVGLLRGLDDVTEDIIDKAIQCSKDCLYDQNHKIKFRAILEKLISIDLAFTYNICVDKSKEITGFVWMTSVMRSNLYCFGSFITVDFMKRQNVHLWPYSGPVVMNELEKPCLVCKSFMLEEQSSAYYFVLMAPNYPKDNLKLIYSNGYF